VKPCSLVEGNQRFGGTCYFQSYLSRTLYLDSNFTGFQEQFKLSIALRMALGLQRAQTTSILGLEMWFVDVSRICEQNTTYKSELILTNSAVPHSLCASFEHCFIKKHNDIKLREPIPWHYIGFMQYSTQFSLQINRLRIV
jgi:hypothetical protein